MKSGDAQIETMGAWEVEQRLRLLVVAAVSLTERPHHTENGFIIVPDGPRRQAESAIEAAANIIAVLAGCKRSISSPLPYIALLAEDSTARAWLDGAEGLVAGHRTIPGTKLRIDLDLGSLESALADRLDGVALLAEALSHDHPTGRFHEFLRLYERAFHLGPFDLVEPLSAFLAQAKHFGYTREEIATWGVDLRHPATHADRRPTFVLEADIRPVIRRMEQAAYEVLFNKAEWRTTSVDRRTVWTPTSGTSSASNSVFILQGTGGALEGQLLDQFHSYPIDLSATLAALPAGWWTGMPHGNQTADPSV